MAKEKNKQEIAILGPENSYCHILAKKTFPNKGFVLCSNIEEIFKKVSNKEVLQGLAPIENMLHGSVRESVIAIKNYRVKINHSYDLPIHHCFASQSSQFKKITSHTQAIAQCSLFLESYRKKGIVIEESSSTSKAMQTASENKDYAAIGSEDAAEQHNLRIINKNIEDNHNNITRFILISSDETLPKEDTQTRTSMLITPKEDKPGLLFEILSVFKIKEINLTKIEAIPSGKKLGDYVLFIEVDGDLKDKSLKEALSFLQTMHEVYSFGSYDLN